MKTRLFLILLTSFYYSVNFAQNTNNVLRDAYYYNGQTCANVWGYSDSLGNEYALVGGAQGMSIVNVTNPDSIWEIVQLPGPNNLWKEIRTYGHYAYCTSEGGNGLQIIDLSNLPNPNLTWHYWAPTINGSTLNKIHALHIDTVTGYIYLYGCNGGFTGTMIAKLTNPYNPTYRGKYGDALSYVHDGIVRNNIMYASKIYDGAVNFINVSVDSLPQSVAVQTTPGSFTHNTWLSDDDKYLFTTDEISNSFLACYDVQDLQNISFMDKIQSNPGSGSIVHNTYYKNGFCYTSWYKDGYTLVDAHRPHNLIQVGNYDTYSDVGNGFHGAWGVYPYLPSGNILLSNIDTSTANNVGALFVVTPTIQQACYLEGNVVDSITNSPLFNVSVVATQTNATFTDITSLSGAYATGSVHSGLYSVTYSKTGYYPKTYNNVVLQNGVVTNLNVKLLSLFTNSLSEIKLKDSFKITTDDNKNIIVTPLELTQNYTVQVLNVSGELLNETRISGNIKKINASNFSSGIYIIKVVDSNNVTAFFKVVL